LLDVLLEEFTNVYVIYAERFTQKIREY